MEDAGNALRFQEGAATPSQRKKLTESVVWKSKSWPTAKESLAAQQSPELKHLLQQVIDRDDWKAATRSSSISAERANELRCPPKGRALNPRC